MNRAKTLVICITGTMTSGKDALRFFLTNYGFKSIRHTSPIFEFGEKNGFDMTKRENWIKADILIRKKNGLDGLAKIVSKEIKEGERYIICPVRHPADIKYFKEKFNAIVFYIDAPFDLRYRRTMLKELGSNLTKDEFKKKDDEEMFPTGKDKKFKTNILECKKYADEIINNDSTLNQLNENVVNLMRKYKIPVSEDMGVYEDFEV